MPGLINAHTHLGMSIFRATNDNMKLDDWLNNKIWPAEAKLTDEDIFKSKKGLSRIKPSLDEKTALKRVDFFQQEL